jgi:dipeptidyl aminopeptidase/acylaminoacyl peptidase
VSEAGQVFISARHPMRIRVILMCFVLVLAAAPHHAAAQASATARRPVAPAAARVALTVDSIMRGPTLVGYPPSSLRWSGDGQRLYFEWQPRDEDEPATWIVARDGSGLRRLSEDERRLAPPVGGLPDRTHRRVLGTDRGDIVVVDTVAGTRIDVTRTTAGESQPRWAHDDTHVTFVRDGGLYIVPVSGGSAGVVIQLAQTGPAKPDPKKSESQRFLEEEEARLLEIVRERAERRKRDEARTEARAIPKLDLTARQSVADMQLDPSGRYVWVLVNEQAEGARASNVPAYVTESAYTTPQEVRTKVGDAQPRRRLAILDLQEKTSVWAALDVPAPEGAAARDVRWGMPQLSETRGIAIAGVRSVDNKDRWFVRVDPATGKAIVLDHLHDDAWVREVGGFGGASGSGWIDDRRFWFLSEASGWMHVYVLDVDAATPAPHALTSGTWEVTGVALSADRTRFYLETTEVHPGERHVYAMSTDGGARTRLTTRTGASAADVSPDDQTIGLVHSSGNRPPEVYVMPNRAGAEPTQVTTSPDATWLATPWLEPTLVTFKARDGVEVPARLYTPEMVGARRHPRRPAVVFVHGAGYLQNAHRYWSSYYREYMFHHLLASRGYVVLDVDYRGSAGYGRDWRTAIYRHMGGKDLDDIVDGAKYLAAEHKVDARRIGVYGGSYGGFITLMAMFTTPDVFAAGAALRPVTDWAHYNHGYTSNILNVPPTDAEAYRRSSPIHFADGLKGALLICHGLVDVNVHAQDSIRLAQKLIELRKEDWELALYPVEDHAFVEETSWADEYKRILKLFETTLKR